MGRNVWERRCGVAHKQMNSVRLIFVAISRGECINLQARERERERRKEERRKEERRKEGKLVKEIWFNNFFFEKKKEKGD